jgi:hypothetical protein
MGSLTKVVVNTHANHIFDLAVTNSWDLTLGHATPGMVIAGAPLGQQSDLYVILRQDSIGSRVANWPASITWASTPPQPGASPVLIHLITLDGVNWYESTTGGV